MWGGYAGVTFASSSGHLPSPWHTLGRRSASPTHCFHIPLLNICVKFIGSCISNMWTLNKCCLDELLLQNPAWQNEYEAELTNHKSFLLTLAFSSLSYLHFAHFALAI